MALGAKRTKAAKKVAKKAAAAAPVKKARARKIETVAVVAKRPSRFAKKAVPVDVVVPVARKGGKFARKFTDEQVAVFKAAGKSLKQKLDHTKTKFVTEFNSFIPSPDEILQMGVQSAANEMVRAVQMSRFTPEQKVIVDLARRRLQKEMNFQIHFQGMPTVEEINRWGIEKAADVLYYASIRWGSIFP